MLEINGLKNSENINKKKLNANYKSNINDKK